MARWLTAEQVAAHQAKRRGETRSERVDPAILEADVKPVVLLALRLHPDVAWCERTNTGAAMYDGRFVRFGWPGQLDITGQMRDGRRLDVECKRPGEHATEDQATTIATVKRWGGVAFVAHGVDDVMRELKAVI